MTVGAEIDLSVDQCRRAINFLLQVDVMQDLAVAVRGHYGQAATLVDQVDFSVACYGRAVVRPVRLESAVSDPFARGGVQAAQNSTVLDGENAVVDFQRASAKRHKTTVLPGNMCLGNVPPAAGTDFQDLVFRAIK